MSSEFAEASSKFCYIPGSESDSQHSSRGHKFAKTEPKRHPEKVGFWPRKMSFKPGCVAGYQKVCEFVGGYTWTSYLLSGLVPKNDVSASLAAY